MKKLVESPKASWRLFLAAGAYLLSCAPFVYSTREGGLTQICRITYLPATMVCFVASCRFLWVTRLRCPGWQCAAALLAAILTGGALLLIFCLLVRFSMSMSDMNR